MTTRLIVLLALLLGTAVLATCQQSRISTAQRERTDALNERDQAIADRNAAQQALAAGQSATTVVTEYVDRVQVVRERGQTIVKEVPVYVTQKADAACTVPAGFVRLYNAAATGTELDASAGDPDAPAEGITLSAVADTTATNFAICRENAETVIALQEFIRGQEEVQQ